MVLVYVWLGIIFNPTATFWMLNQSSWNWNPFWSEIFPPSLFQLYQPSYCQWWQSTTYFPRKYVGLDFMIFKREIMNILTLTSGHTHMIHSNECQSKWTVPVFTNFQDSIPLGKTFRKIETANTMFWMYLGGRVLKIFFLGIKLFCFSR